ncbi:glutathione peroxidase [Flavobacterium sp.]|uniref:glutathione peroxidase n=1 Tax=Flavobacterium sp. TaxID=239 RepID=UPI002628A053|nr:glutathione peroxidase [Flavobacterium sp.]MDG2433162.1 glutathione peroxidase [Flavobacterium sp.]
MKNGLLIVVLSILFLGCQNKSKTNKEIKNKTEQTMHKENLHQFKVVDLSGNEFDFSTLKGKKVMIVNTASKCGLTPQYEGLEAIYKQYQDRNFIVIGFPANNFGAQEPGTNTEIAAFCKRNYGVSFPMMEKVSVKGDDMCAVYQFLTQKAKNGVADSDVEWNFQKYLINEKGELDKVIKPQVAPNDPVITNWIEGS